MNFEAQYVVMFGDEARPLAVFTRQPLAAAFVNEWHRRFRESGLDTNEECWIMECPVNPSADQTELGFFVMADPLTGEIDEDSSCITDNPDVNLKDVPDWMRGGFGTTVEAALHAALASEASAP